MKNYYFTVSIKRNNKQLAYVKCISFGYNLKNLLPVDAIVITPMPTKAAAIMAANSWNQVYNDRNELLFKDHLTYGAPIVKNSIAYWE